MAVTAPSPDKLAATPRVSRLLGVGAAIALLAGPVEPMNCAEETPSLEIQVKAAFLLKLPLFVEWPASAFAGPREPFRIGVLGKDPFGALLDEAAAKEVISGRPVRVERQTDLGALRGCQIVFVADSNHMRAVLEGFKHMPILTVADEAGFARNGGMMNFIKEGGRVRFEINTAATEGGRLRLSAKFLQVSRVVGAGQKGGKG